MAKTTKTKTNNTKSAALLAELNDLLQLDHDAVQAYTLAEKGLSDEGRKSTIQRFKGDHERHITELTRLITAHGGVPVQLPHLPTGPFKLAVQGIGSAGSDATTLLAFKANERLSRDKYQRAANQQYPADVQLVISQGAEDESTHYEWVTEQLEALGAGAETTAGRVEAAIEQGHARTADVIEGVEKRAMRGAEAVRQKVVNTFGGVSSRLGNGGERNVWIAVGVGLVASQVVARRGRKSSRLRGADLSSGSTSTTSPSISAYESRGGNGSTASGSRRGYPGWSETSASSTSSHDVGLPAL